MKMLDSYLKDRLHYIKIGKIESSKKSSKCEFPQGSILGPLLSIIYLNEVPSQTSKEGKSKIYADDTVVFNKGSTEVVGIRYDATIPN